MQGKGSCAEAPARSDSSMMIFQPPDHAKLLELSLKLARVVHKLICPGNFAEQIARKLKSLRISHRDNREPQHHSDPLRTRRFVAMMYCLRRYLCLRVVHYDGFRLTVSSYIPLLLLPLPLSLSPIHLTIFLLLTYLLNRPCIYCSLLLVILFASSCHWSGRCFVDFSLSAAEEGGLGSYMGWFWPRIYSHTVKHDGPTQRANATMIDFLGEVTNSTVAALANAAIDGTKRKFVTSTAGVESVLPYSAGIGIHWLRRLLGRHEWTLPCVGVNIRL